MCWSIISVHAGASNAVYLYGVYLYLPIAPKRHEQLFERQEFTKDLIAPTKI